MTIVRAGEMRANPTTLITVATIKATPVTHWRLVSFGRLELPMAENRMLIPTSQAETL